MPKSYKFSQICPFLILQQQSRGEREKKVEHGKKRGGVGGGVAIGSSPSDGQIRQGSRKKGEEEGIREGDWTGFGMMVAGVGLDQSREGEREKRRGGRSCWIWSWKLAGHTSGEPMVKQRKRGEDQWWRLGGGGRSRFTGAPMVMAVKGKREDRANLCVYMCILLYICVWRDKNYVCLLCVCLYIFVWVWERKKRKMRKANIWE